MFAAGNISGAVSIVSYQGARVRVAENGECEERVLQGAGHHSGGVACVVFARNVETHRSYAHTLTSYVCVCAHANKNGCKYPVHLPNCVLSAQPAVFASPSIETACVRFKHPNHTCIYHVRSESTLYLADISPAARHHLNSILSRTPELWPFAPSNRMRLLTTGNADLAIYEWLLKPVPGFLKRYVKSRRCKRSCWNASIL